MELRHMLQFVKRWTILMRIWSPWSLTLTVERDTRLTLSRIMADPLDMRLATTRLGI